MSKVLARFYVTGVEFVGAGDEQARIKLSAVCRGEENKTWAKATPSGTLEMFVTNKAAIDTFNEIRRSNQDVQITFEGVELGAPTKFP